MMIVGRTQGEQITIRMPSGEVITITQLPQQRLAVDAPNDVQIVCTEQLQEL